MKRESQSQSNEPVGIVISSGTEAQKAPRFSAYIWAPAPELEAEPEVQPV